MKRLMHTFLSIALLMGIAVQASADATGDFKRWYMGGQGKVKRAFEKKDIKFFSSVCTSNFTYKSYDGQVQSKKQALDGLKQMFNMCDKIKAKFTPGKMSVKGNTATVDTSSTFDCVLKPNPQTKKASKMHMQSWERETWVKQGGSWKISKIVETKKPKMLMDGKPFVPPKTAGATTAR